MTPRIHAVLKDHGSLQIATDNLQQTLDMLDTFREPSISRLFLSRYPPPYFGYDPPSSDYGLKLKRIRDMVDGHRESDQLPSARIQLNFDQIEKNRLLAQKPDAVSLPAERISELTERLPFGTPSDWTVENSDRMAAFPVIPLPSLEKKREEFDCLQTSMGQKKVFWQMMKKYYQKYEELEIGSVLQETRQSLEWTSYATTRLDATEPFRGAKKQSFIKVYESSIPRDTKSTKKKRIQINPKEAHAVPSMGRIGAAASMPYKWANVSNGLPSIPLNSSSSSDWDASIRAQTLRNVTPVAQISRNSSITPASNNQLAQTDTPAVFFIRDSAQQHGFKSNNVELSPPRVDILSPLDHSASGDDEIGFRMGHRSVTELKDAQIDYTTIPSATLSSSPFQPFVSSDMPLLQSTPKLHYLHFIKVNQNAANAKLLNDPNMYRLESVVIPERPLKPKIEIVKAGYFRSLTQKGRRRAKAEALKQKKERFTEQWKSQRKRLLHFANAMESSQQY